MSTAGTLIVVLWFSLSSGETPTTYSQSFESQAQCESFRKGMIASFEAQDNKQFADMERQERCVAYKMEQQSEMGNPK